MRIYLDNCAFNRLFDDQIYIRIRLESEAKLFIQSKIKSGEIDLVWSYMLDIENDENPFIVSIIVIPTYHFKQVVNFWLYFKDFFKIKQQKKRFS